ncbi:hypothetical protein AB0C12_05995 [Actinoplanes sp. NPDC048967]|uniref:hypothetical protein n=1 Tax=Actinoplanes sp. NPDC048967 TaxID=3155269 RepID=UPI0033DC8F71
MTPDEAVRAVAARLSTVGWERHGDKTWSKSVLLKEYFRRAARWAAAYDCDTKVPFFDIALCVDPNVRADRGVIDELLESVRSSGWNVRQVVPFILHWAALSATPGFAYPPGLEDPFEPLIRMFERDGGFHTENGEVNLEYKSVRMAGWRNRAGDPPMTVFSDDVLDEIDRAGSIAQFGYVIGPDGRPVP